MKISHFSLAILALIFSATPALAMETEAKQAIVVDYDTGAVLFEKNADEKMHPSSMSKLMTVYILFSHLKDGTLKLTDTLPVSEKAWRTQGSKTFVEIGSRIPVEDLLKGIIIQSGNDACVVVAEALAGSEEAFATQMNDTAKKLGLTNSHFVNATGLPDPNHLMSARDLATLSHALIHDFPDYYHYFSEKEFVHHGITQGNRNLLLYRDDSVDGLKTGHTDEGGYGLDASANDKSGRRLIAIVNGLSSMKERADEAEHLLDYGFRNFDDLTLLHKGELVDKADVWFGEKPQVGLIAQNDVVLTLPKVGREKLKFSIEYAGPLQAPVAQDAHVADLIIESPGTSAQRVPLAAAETVDKVHGFAKISRVIKYYIAGQ